MVSIPLPTGRFTFNIFDSLSEFEREIIRKRAKTGLEAVKTRRMRGGGLAEIP
jgi:DNA invertase Pin-like site-specific DNA recombinase